MNVWLSRKILMKHYCLKKKMQINHAKRVCKNIEIKNLGEHLKSNTVLLADILENFFQLQD